MCDNNCSNGGGLFFATDSTEVVKLKCTLVENELRRIHSQTGQFNHPDNVMAVYEKLVTTFANKLKLF